jgi:hypothetical protein
MQYLARESEAIDRGVALEEGIYDGDMDGDPRPAGAGRNIGADEVFDFVSRYRPFLAQ